MNRHQAQIESVKQERTICSDIDEYGISYFYEDGILKHQVHVIESREQLLDQEAGIYKPSSSYMTKKEVV